MQPVKKQQQQPKKKYPAYKCYSKENKNFRHLSMENDTEGQKQCPLCQKQFSDKYTLKTHLKGVHNLSPHICKGCNKSFNCVKALKNHIEITHITNSKMFKKPETNFDNTSTLTNLDSISGLSTNNLCSRSSIDSLSQETAASSGMLLQISKNDSDTELQNCLEKYYEQQQNIIYNGIQIVRLLGGSQNLYYKSPKMTKKISKNKELLESGGGRCKHIRNNNKKQNKYTEGQQINFDLNCVAVKKQNFQLVGVTYLKDVQIFQENQQQKSYNQYMQTFNPTKIQQGKLA